MKLLIVFLLGIIIGVSTGTWSSRFTVNRVNAWMDTLPLSDQYDFITARLKFLPGVRRQIAENWCLQNPNTLRICRSATRYAHPVRPSLRRS